MVHIPVGIPGWTVFAAGLAIVAVRIHGIDSPRAWIEWMERQFVDKRLLQFFGAVLCMLIAVLIFLARPIPGTVGTLYVLSLGVFGLTGLLLMLGQNQLRMIFVATAEAEDATIRMMSIIIVLVGLCVALAPWFF